MRRSVLVLLTAVSLLLAGCGGETPGSSPPDSATTASPADASSTPTLTATPTGSDTEVPPTSPPPETSSSPTATASELPGPHEPVEYVVRVGKIPDEFDSVTVTFQVVFVDNTADLGPCYPEIFSGPYKPTITPLLTPSGECHRLDRISMDLTEIEGERSLGNFTAPASTSGHALIVTDIAATRHNGTAVTTIRGMGGLELIESANPPEGRYGIEVGIESVPDDRRYGYWVLTERFDPS